MPGDGGPLGARVRGAASWGSHEWEPSTFRGLRRGARLGRTQQARDAAGPVRRLDTAAADFAPRAPLATHEDGTHFEAVRAGQLGQTMRAQDCNWHSCMHVTAALMACLRGRRAGPWQAECHWKCEHALALACNGGFT